MSNPAPRHQRSTKLPSLLFGAPYYPEHWSEEERRIDAQRMAQAGVNVVRMAEFAWDRMEPQPSLFDFSLFDETIAQLGRHGISTILCTPTATPPRWLTVEHDDWMRVDASGKPMRHGSRQHCCTNNPSFRAESRRITGVMADHFADNTHIVGWQTDNELYCHMSECYCPSCETAFREWLRAKYRTVEALNAAWGTQFWSQTYRSIEHIPLPCIPERPTYTNPGHQLDYYRFLSDSLCDFQREQISILRAARPAWWITHNGIMNHVDYWEFARDLDLLGVDVYPGFSVKQPADSYGPSLLLEQCRAASGCFIVPEQQAGAGGQRPYLHETPRPGQMRLWAYQSIAHGADGVLHFRWRSCRYGAEIYWNGVLDHDNEPRRRLEEFSREGAELDRIGPVILGTTVDIRAGVLVEQDQVEAHAAISLGLPSPQQVGSAILAELWRRHLPAGYVCAADSFDGLSLLFVPSFAVMDEDLASRLRAFVERGGVLVVTARSGTRDRNNRVIAQTPPGLLAELCGVTVEEFGRLNTPLLRLHAGEIDIPPGAAYEQIRLNGAQPLAVWSVCADGGPHAAALQPAIAAREVGRGKAIYVGTFVDGENAHMLLDVLLPHAPITPLATADDFVEIICRRSETARLHFVLNHYPETKSVRGLPKGKELISNAKCDGTLELEPYGVAIVRTA
jgi:beta-galactosidase